MADAPSIQQALAAVMDDVKAVAKGDRNAQQGFSFRGIDAVVNAVGPALRRHGVVVLPELVDHTYGEIQVGQGQQRRPIAHVLVMVRYTFHGPAGDSLSAVTMGEAMDAGDKAVAKAMSVAYRIALLQSLTLPTDEADPDQDVYVRTPEPPPLRAQVWQAWQAAKLPKTKEAVEAAYAQWTQGEVIADATDDQLSAFLAAINDGQFKEQTDADG